MNIYALTNFIVGCFVRTRFVDLGCGNLPLVGSNSNHTPTYRVLYAMHGALRFDPDDFRRLGGLKWTRTTDLALIRRAL